MKLNTRGFTLIELMISIAISVVVGASLFSFFSVNQKIFAEEGRLVDMQQNARAALNFISEYIINAGYNPRQIEGIDPIDSSSNETYIKIYADLDGNGEISEDNDNEVAVFYFDSKKQALMRTMKGKVRKSNHTVIDNISDLRFQYDSSPPNTKYITISLTAKTDKKIDGAYKTLTLETDVVLRNRL